jgi:hypothetical protein
MLVRSMVRLVEHEQADVAPEVDVAVAECIEEHVGRADDDAVRVKHAMPQLPVSPLVRFVCAGNEANGDGEVSRDDCLLLPRERDCRCEEPGDLRSWIDVHVSDGYDGRRKQKRETHLARIVLCLAFHPQDRDVRLSCSRVERDDDVPPHALLKHLLLIPACAKVWYWRRYPISTRCNLFVRHVQSVRYC